MLEGLARADAGQDLASYARAYGVDERTVRRDLAALQEALSAVRQVEIRRGRVYATQPGFGVGYFAGQVERHQQAKEAIASRVVAGLEGNQAIALTAGSTAYFVAREIRRVCVEEERLQTLIAFTNSLPALLELVSAGLSTGVLGDVYNADDSAFHSHDYRSAFQPSLAIVGASGVVANPTAGTVDLFSHRAEEAAFLKQLLEPVPEILVAVDASKLGHRHPWSFTGGSVLAGKTVRLCTAGLTCAQRETLDRLSAAAKRSGCAFSYDDAPGVPALSEHD